MFALIITTSIVVVIGYFIIVGWKVNQRWKNAGIPHVKPILFFGNMFDMVTRTRTQAEIIRDIYNQFPNEPVVGYYHFLSPRLLIRDLRLVEKVLKSDFPYFMDRTFPVNIKSNPLVVNLFSLCGNAWRAVRNKFTPMFTTGKLRYMFPQVSSMADDLMEILDKNQKNVNIKDETSKFAMEVIGSCVFGIEPKTLDSGENEFRREAKIAFQPSFRDFVRMTTLFTLPKLAQKLKLTFVKQRSVEYFSNVVRTTLHHRKTTKQTRNDFVQLMVTLQEKGYIEVENNDPSDDYLNIEPENVETTAPKEVLELTDDVMIGQAFVFLLAGFEATATAIAFMCLELAANPTVQTKAREEVKKALETHGEITFDVLRDEMKYLDGCFRETMRLHAPVGNIIRLCVKRYDLPGTSVTVQPGEFVMISSLGIHTDPNIYPEPEKFLPERWADDVSRPACTYLPFGDGPRICIGLRFATMEVKCCMAKILSKYKITPHPNAKLPLKTDSYSFFGAPIKPMLCNFDKLES